MKAKLECKASSASVDIDAVSEMSGASLDELRELEAAGYGDCVLTRRIRDGAFARGGEQVSAFLASVRAVAPDEWVGCSVDENQLDEWLLECRPDVLKALSMDRYQLAVANRAFDDFVFGPIVEGVSGWEYEQGGVIAEMNIKVFLEQENRDAPTEAVRFRVSFTSDGDLAEACALDAKGHEFGILSGLSADRIETLRSNRPRM